MPTVDLTPRLARESRPGDKDTILFDRSLPGFGLRIHPSGRKVYIVQARILAYHLPAKIEHCAAVPSSEHQQPDRGDGRRKDGLTSSELKELRQLDQEVRPLREEREVLAKDAMEAGSNPAFGVPELKKMMITSMTRKSKKGRNTI